MALSAKRRLSCKEVVSEPLQEDTGICLDPLQFASGEVIDWPQRSKKSRRKQRQAAFGSISMREAPDACDTGWFATSPKHHTCPVNLTTC